jgi:hypothetical protein
MQRGALLFVLMLGIPVPMPGQMPNATLSRALQAYDSLDYSGAIVMARRALGERLNGEEQERAYELLGFAYAASDSQAKAVDAFKQVFLLDPDHQLDASRISPKITSLFYSALGQVLVVRQLRVDSATFVNGEGAVPFHFTLTTPARVRVRAVSGASALLVDSLVATGTVDLRWPARLPGGDPVAPGTWLLVVDATAGQNTFSASQLLRVGHSPVDTVPYLTGLPGYQELPEMETPPRSWRPLGLAFLFTTAAAAGTVALNNSSLGSTPSRELAVVSAATLVTGLVMTLRTPAPRPAEANILYNRLLHEQLARRNAEVAQENAKRRQQVALTIVPLPKGGVGR